MTRLCIKTDRAPYIRGGLRFESRRTPMVIEADALTAEQRAALERDPAITISEIAPDGKAAAKAKAKDEAKAGPDSGPEPKPEPDSGPKSASRKSTKKGKA